METQDILNMETGEKEMATLKPATVEIKDVTVNEVGEKKLKKISCLVKHPDSNDVIEISSVKYEKKGKLKVSGLWVKYEKKEEAKDEAPTKLQKGSALTIFLGFAMAKNPKELEGKEVETVMDDRGFLCFKAY